MAGFVHELGSRELQLTPDPLSNDQNLQRHKIVTVRQHSPNPNVPQRNLSGDDKPAGRVLAASVTTVATVGDTMDTTTRDFRSDTSMTVNLGMPTPPVPTLVPRRKTHQIKVGDVLVGGDAPVSVQSMTTTKTHDIGATLQQIAALTAAGCDIVRVACPTDKDAEALPIAWTIGALMLVMGLILVVADVVSPVKIF